MNWKLKLALNVPTAMGRSQPSYIQLAILFFFFQDGRVVDLLLFYSILSQLLIVWARASGIGSRPGLARLKIDDSVSYSGDGDQTGGGGRIWVRSVLIRKHTMRQAISGYVIPPRPPLRGPYLWSRHEPTDPAPKNTDTPLRVAHTCTSPFRSGTTQAPARSISTSQTDRRQ